jgi:hypothetical protein
VVVVVLTAGGALLALHAYNRMPAPRAEEVLFTIKQGAAVLAALCAAIFAVITALQQGKPPGSLSGLSSAVTGSSTAGPLFGGRAIAAP